MPRQPPTAATKNWYPAEIFQLFKDHYENVTLPYNITEVHFKQHNGIIAEVTTTYQDKTSVIIASETAV